MYVHIHRLCVYNIYRNFKLIFTNLSCDHIYLGSYLFGFPVDIPLIGCISSISVVLVN